jgi:protocatechuate 3,4-dioxygenase, beta subunit
MKQNRRTFIKSGVLSGLAASTAALHAADLQPTPTEIKGPFYPIQAQKDKDFDLTQIEGMSGLAAGKHIFIEGVVVDTDSNPIEDVTVDLWQANAAGRYRHPHDPNTAPLDPNFQGWAIVPSGVKGEFRFKTVFPGTYPLLKVGHAHHTFISRSQSEATLSLSPKCISRGTLSMRKTCCYREKQQPSNQQ